eukprot:12615-Heterococcus_DN1.PRE.1
MHSLTVVADQAASTGRVDREGGASQVPVALWELRPELCDCALCAVHNMRRPQPNESEHLLRLAVTCKPRPYWHRQKAAYDRSYL